MCTVEGGGPAIFPFDSRNCLDWQIESKIRGFPTQARAWFGFSFVIFGRPNYTQSRGTGKPLVNISVTIKRNAEFNYFSFKIKG
jgi:hypothetical protein